MSAIEQQQMLRAIWPKWRQAALRTDPTDHKATERAVQKLYAEWRLPSPTITWISAPRRLHGELIPLRAHGRETLIYAVWGRLLRPEWVSRVIGYDIDHDRFNLQSNNVVVLSNATVAVNRFYRRPMWARRAENILSQFDVDALALLELAKEVGIRIDSHARAIATHFDALQQATFGALFFEGLCLLIERPTSIALNERQLISKQLAPALVFSDGRSIYAVDGKVLSVDEKPAIAFGHISLFMSRRERSIAIEFLGWERFFNMVDSHRKILVDDDKYGELYRLEFADGNMLVVRVRNRTREPDGTYRYHVIPVQRELRPLPDPNDRSGRMGEPQALTALNAVASTFGMTGEQYARTIGKQS